MSSPDRYYRAALICGLVPLATGIAIFLLWALFGGNAFAFAGALTIVAGILSVIVGGSCLIAYAEKSLSTMPRPPVRRRLVTAAIALLINFPAALLVLVAVFYLIPSELTVENHGPNIERFTVTGGGADIDVGAIATGETIVVNVLIWHAGALEFQATRAGKEIRGPIEGGVTPGAPSFPILIFDADGSWGSHDRDEDDVDGMHF